VAEKPGSLGGCDFFDFSTPEAPGLRWLKSFERHGQHKHRRGPSHSAPPSAVSPDKSVRRFAQDDGFVGTLTKSTPWRLTLTRLTFWGILSRPCGTAPFPFALPRTASWAPLSRPCGARKVCLPDATERTEYQTVTSSRDDKSGSCAPHAVLLLMKV
jgi:hypothetical protein